MSDIQINSLSYAINRLRKRLNEIECEATGYRAALATVEAMYAEHLNSEQRLKTELGRD